VTPQIIVLLVGCWIVFSVAMTVKYHGKPLLLIDFPSLTVVILAALDIGARAFFDIDPAAMLLGSYYRAACSVVGVCAIWQFCRQRYW
jgi:uncharacterized membrane protein YuzA (DUF378 family)